MIDFSKIHFRTLEIKLNDRVSIKLTPPKISFLKKMSQLEKNEDVDKLVELIAELLSKNTENKKFTKTWVESNLTIDEVMLIFSEYTDWIKNIKNSPN